MNQQHYSLKEIAAIVGVKAHRISYAITNGALDEPVSRITNRRIFTESDLEAAKKYFQTQPKLGRPPKSRGGK